MDKRPQSDRRPQNNRGNASSDRDATRHSPAPPKDFAPFDGVILVDKPAGPTSHDIVAGIRRTFRIKKVGHGGTLDPQATGLLVVLLGRGTKLSSRFIGSDKAYEGTMMLGTETDSQDADGKVTREAPYDSVTRDQLFEEMQKLTGDTMQTPPMVSAIKVKGVPLYKHARKGRVIEREPRLVHVYKFDLVRFDPPDADFVLSCTKGTYARTLCADAGEALGCGAHVTRLRRTRCGEVSVSSATAYEDVLKMTGDELLEKIIPMKSFLKTPGPA